MKNLNIYLRGLKLMWSGLIEYKESFAGMLVGGILELGITLILWGIIFSKVPSINGWTLPEVVILQGFLFVWFGLSSLLFQGASHLDDLITLGDLDKYLTRPVDPLLIHMAINLDFGGIVGLIKAVIYFIIGVSLGASFNLLGFALGVLISIIASFVFAFIMLSLGFLAFWIGRADSILGVMSHFWHIGNYPMGVYPKQLQFIFTLILPLFVSTSIPAMMFTGMISIESALEYLGITIGLFIFWGLIMNWVWKTGLARYDSYGG